MRAAQPPTVQPAPVADRSVRQTEGPTARGASVDRLAAPGDGGDPIGRLLRAKRLGHRVDVLMARRTIARSTCSGIDGCRAVIQRDVVQREGDETAAPLIVEDAASLAPGQVDRETFLVELQAAVGEIADEILAEIGQTSDDCPYITYWFAYYGGRNAAQIETAVHRFAPTTVDSTSWQDVVSKVADRVGEGLRNFVETGSVAAIPEELPDDLHDEKAAEMIIQRCGSGDDAADDVPRGRGTRLTPSTMNPVDFPAKTAPVGLSATTVRDLTRVDREVEALLNRALSRYPGKLTNWRGTCFLAAYEFEQAIQQALRAAAKSAHVQTEHSGDHYFVVVFDGRDNLIVDPTWRQFASNASIGDRFSGDDVLVGTVDEVSERLRKEASVDGGLASKLDILLQIYRTGLGALNDPEYFCWSKA